MTVKVSYIECPAYITRDGSEIRELMHPDNNEHCLNQSLAEAIVQPGQTTLLHRHHLSEEIYYITRGSGQMTLGTGHFPVSENDSIVIPPGTPHCIQNPGKIPLHILCCCSPAYQHDDTELIEV